MTQIGFFNGEFSPLDQISISPLDRGYMFADGVYEVVPLYEGQPLALAEHLERLWQGLAALHITVDFQSAQLAAWVQQLIAYSSPLEAHASLYMQVTRGTPQKRHHDAVLDLSANVLMYIQAWCPITDGLKVTALEDIRWHRGDIKSIGLIGSVLLRQQAQAQGYDDAILYRNGALTEATSANLFLVLENEICTPPLSHHLLGGITRKILIEAVQKNGVVIHQRSILQNEWLESEEIWVSSAMQELRPVISIDGRPVGSGQVGPVYRKMKQLFDTYKQSLLSNA